MTEGNFYTLVKSQWNKSLPKLLEQIISRGNKVHVFCDDEAFMNELDNLIWTFEQLAFVPHGTFKDPMPEVTPIILSTEENKLNNANILVITGKKLPSNLSDFDKIIFMHHETDKIAREQILGHMKILEKNGIKHNFFRQNGTGSWERAINV